MVEIDTIDVIVGKYKIAGQIGKGGVGTVFGRTYGTKYKGSQRYEYLGKQ